ncbi:MAG TPA: hypothetical protein VIT91_07065 [Chthoniobacterales bacterium]
MENLLFLLLVGLIALLRWLFFGGGLKRILESLQGDLQNTNKQGPQRTAPPVMQRPANGPRPGETAEERQMRKFMEALGLPSDPAAPPQPRPQPPPTPRPVPPPQNRAPLPIPPVVADNVQRRLQKEVERLRRRKEANERKRSQLPPPPLPASPVLSSESVPAEETAVGRYFRLEKFGQPNLAAAAPEPTFKPPAILGVGGNREDLRRMIIAREILGPPKSLQRF